MNFDNNTPPIAVAGTRRTLKEMADGTIRVSIDIDPIHRSAFFQLFPNIDMPVALAALQPAAAVQGNAPADPYERVFGISSQSQPPAEAASRSPSAPPKREPNDLARALMVNGFFRNPQLWARLDAAGIYTEKEHKDWVLTQSCAIAKLAPHIPCEGPEIHPHHARSAALPAGAKGNPMKVPHWYCLPTCHKHHMGWIHASHGAVRADHHKLIEIAVQMTADRVKEVVKETIGIASLADITKQQLDELCNVLELPLFNHRERA